MFRTLKSLLLPIFACLLVSPAQGQLPVRRLHQSGLGGDGYGSSVADLGDIDGDNVPDYGIGSARPSSLNGNFPGKVEVFSGASGTRLYTLSVGSTDDLFGSTLTAVPDVDGDFVPDLAVGMPGFNSTPFSPGIGQVLLFSGATGTLLQTFSGRPGAAFGGSVAGLGDLDGDGFGEIAAGGPQFDGIAMDSGYVEVYSGGTGTLLYSWQGLSVRSRLGISIANGGDLNGDGFDDILLIDQASNAGFLRAISGQTGTILYDISSGPNQWRVVDGAEDIDGDGLSDYIVGGRVLVTPFISNSFVAAVSGGSGAVIWSTLNSDQEFAQVVAGVGDVTGDGIPDFAAGQPEFCLNPPCSLSGFYVYDGATGLQVLSRFTPDGESLGRSLSRIGDINGDGFDEMIVGASGGFTFPEYIGRVEVISVGGSRNYGPTQPLALDWIPGALPSDPADGDISITGAPAGASGSFLLSLGSADIPILGIRLLIDPAPLVTALDFTYDATGGITFPFNIRSPGLSGVVFFAQALGISGATLLASNGIEIIGVL